MRNRLLLASCLCMQTLGAAQALPKTLPVKIIKKRVVASSSPTPRNSPEKDKVAQFELVHDGSLVFIRELMPIKRDACTK